jgi:hypothetical protein
VLGIGLRHLHRRRVDEAVTCVLATHKNLTTSATSRSAWRTVIGGFIGPSAVRMVSISTTLAITIAGKKRVTLFLIGYDPELLANFQLDGRRYLTVYHFQGQP